MHAWPRGQLATIFGKTNQSKRNNAGRVLSHGPFLYSLHTDTVTLSALKSGQMVDVIRLFFPPRYWHMQMAWCVFQWHQHGRNVVDICVVPVLFGCPKQFSKGKAQTGLM